MSTPFVVSAPAPGTGLHAALAPFRDYLADRAVTDLFVNGEHGLFVDRGDGACRDAGWRASEREVRDLAAALVAAGGRHVDDAHPCVDVRLAGGIRVHVVLAPVSASGTAVSIRIPRVGAPKFADLRRLGSFDRGTEQFLLAAVARRANFLISGAAGVGKTTMLAALLGEAPSSERILTVEDVAELQIDHPHHVALEARQANLEGAGGIGLTQLVREALRMRPDRLALGECRGAEVRELLAALNTGHDGGAGTVHANSLADVPARLEALGALAGLDDVALARQVSSAIEFVVHLERAPDGTRRVEALGRFRIVGRRLTTQPVDAAEIGAADPDRRAVDVQSTMLAPPDAADPARTDSAPRADGTTVARPDDVETPPGADRANAGRDDADADADPRAGRRRAGRAFVTAPFDSWVDADSRLEERGSPVSTATTREAPAGAAAFQPQRGPALASSVRQGDGASGSERSRAADGVLESREPADADDSGWPAAGPMVAQRARLGFVPTAPVSGDPRAAA